MLSKSRLSIALITSLLAFQPVVNAATEITGERRGAFFRIVMPDDWNGGLVIWGRGLDIDPLPTMPDLGPLSQLQLSQGYAVAATSYSQIGWSLFQTERDYRTLLRVFKKNFGKPNELFVTGGSLGGLVSAQVAERLRRDQVDGVYSLCGPLAGKRNWDLGLDLRLVYDFVCGGVPGAAIPGGAKGLQSGSTFSETDLALAVNQCTGVLTPPDSRTAEQSARLQQILDENTIPESFLVTVMGYSTLVLADLVHDPRKLGGYIGVGNRFVHYKNPLIDSGIERVTPDFWSALNLYFNYTPTGRVRGAKVVSLHTDKDGLVFVENQGHYRAVTPRNNLTTGIVVEDSPSHCGFTEAEAISGWEELRTWVAGEPQPTVEDLQTTCGFAELSGLAVGPCRFDPEYQVNNFDTRTPSRFPFPHKP